MIWLMYLLSGCCNMGLNPGEARWDLSDGISNKPLKVKPQQSLCPIADSPLPIATPGLVADQCDDVDHGGGRFGPDCATRVIECGDQIIGHTVGGVDKYDSRFYEKNFCTPKLSNHDGGDERVYQLRMPPGEWTAFVDLASPCADLDLAAIQYSGDTCPPPDAMIRRCEMWPKPRTQGERVQIVSQNPRGSTWWIVVEGKNEQEGAFSLAVQCRKGLM